MKILILANNDVGLYNFRKELMQALIKKENVLYVSLPDGELVNEIKSLGVQIISTPIDRRGINPLTDIKLIVRYIKMFLELKPDLVITYTIKPNIYGGIVSRLLKKKYTINITGLGTAFQSENMIKKLVCLLYKISTKKAKVVFFENEENKQIFINLGLIREEQGCRLNGAGVNLEEYPYTEYPDKNEPIRFLFIGRIMKEKGVDELFEAARKIKKEYQDVCFDIVGPMEDEYGSVIKGNMLVPDEDVVLPLKKVIRVATDEDTALAAENKIKENDKNSEIIFVGTNRGLENDLVPRSRI